VTRAQSRTLVEGADGSLVRQTVLPGGLRVITERVPGVQSASFGVWVGAGSRDEPARQMGSAHYLEHLLFKGTQRRSALEISASIEAVGGDLNAFTTKEYTAYYARVLGRDLPLAIDVVCDVVTDALLDEADVEAERSVILEEIAMYEDEPADLIHDVFTRQLFGDTPLGRPILGTTDTIQQLPRAAIRRFYRSRYRPPNIVVAAAGHLDHDLVVRHVRRAFAAHLDPMQGVADPRSGRRVRVTEPDVHIVPRASEQANLILGVPGIARNDPRRYAMAILTTALGGGMSSRLFQEVREKRGLAYSVYAYAQGFVDGGIFGVYVGCLPNKVDTVLDVCRTQLDDVARHGLAPEELERSKGQVRGATVLGQEDTGARMTRIAKAAIHGEPLLSIPDLLGRIDTVTQSEVRDLAADMLKKVPSLAVIGPFDRNETFSTVA
jgi:predicted Zn-dependent peptidase